MILKPKDIKTLCEDYQYEFDTFTEEDDKIRRVKKALSEIDRSDFVIMCLYAELKSERKVAAQLNCSAPTINKILRNIRKEIVRKLNEYDATPNFDC